MKHGGILTKVVGGAVATAVAAPVAAGICAGVILANTGIENAEFVGYSGEQGLTAEQLYNATNTFHYNGNPFDFVLNGEGNQDDVVKYRKFNNYYAASETEQRNDNAVSTALPQITFLTHGLNGGAFHWSNKETVNEDNDPIYKFAYSNSSLITQLSASIAGSAQVYWAKMQSHNTFKLYDLNNPNNIEKGVYQEEVTVSKLDSASPHIIVVFEANKDAKQGYNNEVYEEFNYVVSKLVYDIKCLNDGLLPKINLIGHSRGGLTNLQYALDHPDLVDSMFGLGTPYIGSTTAETKLGKRMQDSFGREDIIDDDVFLGYYNRWTNNRSIYQNIRAHALGGYSTVDFALLQLRNFAEKMYGISIGDDIFQYLCGVIKDKKDNIEDINNLTLFINKLFNIFDAPVNEILEVIKVLFKEIDDYKNDPVVRLQTVIHASSDMLLDNDILVDLRSQLGSGYGLDYNFNLYAKCFTKDEGKLSSPTQPAVVHNLEAQDPNFIGYILRNIDLGNTSGPVYRITDDNTVTLLGYRGAILSERFEVPREINGYKVTRIESEAFSNAFGTNLKEIVIPYTLKEIGKYAFANCNFKQVTFEEGSQLKVIEEGAFFNCQNLNKFHSQAEGTLAIPNNVEQVYKNAFFGAKNIRKITLPSGVSYLEREALAGLSGLTEINVESGNAVYRAEGGNLYNRDGWLLQYCAGKTETEFSVPSAVQGVEITAIAKSAFADAKSLQAVNLSNVRIVDELAFNRCLNLQTVRGDSVYYVERNAFSSTPWYQDYEGDYVGIGKTLIEYRGTSDIVMLSEYSSVGAGAFAGNVNIKEIVLGKAVDYIGAMAFYECGNLKTVKLLRADTVAGLGDFAFPENESLVLCVPEPLLSTYEEHGVWKNYHLNALNTTVLFESNGGTQQEAVHLNYYQTIGELPEPTKTGYLFAGWFYDWKCEGTRIENSDLWERSDDTATLYAKWEAELYSVEYQCTGGEFTDEVYRNYTCETEYPFAIPVRVGYTFDGWFYDKALLKNAGVKIPRGSVGNKIVYAKWSVNEYAVLFDLNDDSQSPAHLESGNSVVLFGSEDFAFSVPVRAGYTFNGWKTAEGKFVTDENGEAVCQWDIAEDVTLCAAWTREKYFIKIDADGQITWLGANGFTDSKEESGIEYGTELGDYERLKEVFNASKQNLREGHKFDHFSLNKDGEEFNFWNGIVRDLGEDGAVIEIYACFVPEINFTIILSGMMTDDGVLRGKFNDVLNLPVATKNGYTFAGWCVADRVENEIFKDSSVFALGSDFQFTKMPDLSFNREEDGTAIYLSAKFTPNTYMVSFETMYGCQVAATTVTFGSVATFDVPSARGRQFVGWYYVDESGNKRQIADHNGRLTNLWNIDKNVRLYPEYNLITYRVHYEGLSNADSLFNIESDAFDLPKPTKSGYRFIGWYSDPDYKQRVYNVPHGSVGDKTVYAYFKKLYTITFQNEGNKILSVSMVLNETIQTPGAAKDNYDGVWNDGTNNYAFESSFTLKTEKNVTLYAVWTGKSYAITYCNTVGFRGDSAYVSAPYFYTYGVGLSFSGYKASFSSAYNNQTHYEFVGFYQNSELTTPYTRISTQDSGNKTVYLRWRLIIDHRYRSGLKEITDEYDVNDENEISKMPYDSVGIGLENDARYNNMVSMGIKYIHITLEMEMWEKNDGYQCIFVCKDNTGQYIDIAEEKRVFDIDGSFTEDNPYKFKVEYLIELDQLKKVSSLYIRYGADGHSYDTWCNNNVHINVQAVFDESDVKSVNGKHSIMY